MNDLFHKITNMLDHDRWKCLVVVLVIAMVVCAVSCHSKTASIVDPSRQVTREQLAMETIQFESDLALERADIDTLIAKHNQRVKTHNAQLETRIGDLDHKDEIKAQMFEVIGSLVTGWATTGKLPTSALIGSAITIGSIGLGLAGFADKRRADKVITKMKSETTPT